MTQLPDQVSWIMGPSNAETMGGGLAKPYEIHGIQLIQRFVGETDKTIDRDPPFVHEAPNGISRLSAMGQLLPDDSLPAERPRAAKSGKTASRACEAQIDAHRQYRNRHRKGSRDKPFGAMNRSRILSRRRHGGFR
jgi:hypothetical protein